jgi:16S rRNA (uracil1498-N3)-methyltransferase
MRCFFYNPDQDTGDRVRITGSEARHMSTVLRMPSGTRLELFDGNGGIICGEILRITPREVSVRVLSRSAAIEPGPPLTLAQAMLKGKKMDVLIQKATELGVHTFIPLISRFCEKRVQGRQQSGRWQRIMLEACKQCGRPLPMYIGEPIGLEQLRPPAGGNRIMAWEDEQSQPLSPALLNPQMPTFVIIGPEGGFHSSEINEARQRGFTTISLGPCTLRAETAAMSAVAILRNYNLLPDHDEPENVFKT